MKIEQKRNYRVLESSDDFKKVIFVFTAMGTKIPQYRFFLRALKKRGYHTIIFDYNTDLVLEARLDEYEPMYLDLAKDAQARLKRLQKNGTTKFFAYGTSVGSVLANRFTRETPEITHLVLNLTYGDVTEHVMESPVTRKSRMAMKRKGISVETLRSYMDLYDPILHAQELVGRKVLLHLSRRDRALRYERTKLTKRALENAGVDVTYQESKFHGHYGAGIKHMLKVSTIDKFLQT